MKKLLLLLLVTVAANTYAQNSWFLQPFVGLGSGNIISKDYTGTISEHGTFTYDGGLNIGYQARRLGLISGLAYLRTGSQQTLSFSSSTYPYTTLNTEILKTYFSHIIMPLHVSYRLKAGNKLAIVPVLGVDAAYNLSEKENLPTKHKMLQDKFSDEYHRISLFGAAQVNVSYAISKRLSIFAGPSIAYMLTNFDKVPAGAPYKASVHNYAILCNAGLQYNLSHKKTK